MNNKKKTRKNHPLRGKTLLDMGQTNNNQD